MKEPELILTHGAGASSESAWMTNLKVELNKVDLNSFFFNFPYMNRSIKEKRRLPPARAEVLENDFVNVIESFRQEMVIGGKSMGGRIASRISYHPQVKKIICFGFPFFKSDKSDYTRLEDLLTVTKPVLIFQGTKDPMGSLKMLEKIDFPENFKLVWIEDADHDLRFSGEIPFETMAKMIKLFLAH